MFKKIEEILAHTQEKNHLIETCPQMIQMLKLEDKDLRQRQIQKLKNELSGIFF